jgi:hypothetical protein
LFHNGTINIIEAVSGDLHLRLNGSEEAVIAKQNGAVELYHNNTKRLETFDNNPFVGVAVTNDILLNGSSDTAIRWAVGGTASSNFKWGMFYSNSSNQLNIFDNVNSRNMAAFKESGAIELNYAGGKKFETTSYGAKITDTLHINTDQAAVSGIKHIVYGGASLYQNSGTGTGGNQGLYIGNGTSNTDAFIWNYESAALQFATNGTQRFKIDSSGHVLPASNNTYDLGSTSYRWRNIYTNDLHLSNEGHSNDVDGTWGNWTIQEGESDLFLKNNRSGKKYKFNLTEVS